jgi:chemotaxis protein MotB
VSGHRGRRKQHDDHQEEHLSHERWLVTYADMLTLLMVLFIVLFAISMVDQKKFMQLATGMASGFGQPVSITDGNTSVLPEAAAAKPAADAAPVLSVDAVPMIAQEVSHGTGASATSVAAGAAAARDAKALDQATATIQAALKKAGLEGKAVVTRDSRGITISLVVDDLVFGSDSAQLMPSGQQLLRTIGPALKTVNRDIEVEGHTNQVAGHPKNYPTEWELSSARACSVVRFLVSDVGLAPNTMSATGYADTRPLISPSDPRSVTLNRRVDIVVLSSLTPEQQALVDLSKTQNG